MLIAIAFIIAVAIFAVAFAVVQIVSAIENARACRGVTIYRERKDGTLERIK